MHRPVSDVILLAEIRGRERRPGITARGGAAHDFARRRIGVPIRISLAHKGMRSSTTGGDARALQGIAGSSWQCFFACLHRYLLGAGPDRTRRGRGQRAGSLELPPMGYGISEEAHWPNARGGPLGLARGSARHSPMFLSPSPFVLLTTLWGALRISLTHFRQNRWQQRRFSGKVAPFRTIRPTRHPPGQTAPCARSA
jgi:hypothetical protein